MFMGTIIAAIAGIPHAGLGHVELKALAWLLCGSVPAVWLARHVYDGLPRRISEGIIAGASIVMGWHFMGF